MGDFVNKSIFIIINLRTLLIEINSRKKIINIFLIKCSLSTNLKGKFLFFFKFNAGSLNCSYNHHFNGCFNYKIFVYFYIIQGGAENFVSSNQTKKKVMSKDHLVPLWEVG